ncbi:MAG: hypothetical protein CMF69_04080 [Magnetovibrio sp.]|nr:hypothetical protein [Magnetovibrio sp.]|tara:strand:+ start:1005 stop:1415 length:411 start_codon:yes stop_codon:yes gene_type:complete
MYRILKPGGRIAIIETDWRSVVLNAKNDNLTRRMFTAWDNAAISPNLPVKLKPKLYAEGFKNVTITGIPILNTEFNTNTFSSGMLHGVAQKACQIGAVTKAEADEWITDMHAKDASGSYFFCVNRFLFNAEKADTD